MGLYEIWGQNEEENAAHANSYSVPEAVGIEADSAPQALQKFMMEGLTAAAEADDFEQFRTMFPEPANGDHWHYKIVDSFDHTQVIELAARFRMIPTLEMVEIKGRPLSDVEDNAPPESI